MTRPNRLFQHCTQRIIDHAGMVMPSGRRGWARAMHAELTAIPERLDGMRWAFGCLRAAYWERIRVVNPLGFAPARVLLALLILGDAHGLVFTAKLAWTYRTDPAWSMKYLGPADIPVYASMPLPLMAVLALSAILYAPAAAYLICNRARALPWYLAALGMQFIALVGLSRLAASLDTSSDVHQLANYPTWLCFALFAILLGRAARTGTLSSPGR